jgi:hypothetical protein
MTDQVIDPEKEDREKREKYYREYDAETNKRLLSSSENFDKSILTYSSGGLAISLTFLKDFIPIAKSDYLFLLYGSWIFFTAATVLTTISFSLAYKQNEKSIGYAYKYIIEGNECFQNKMSWQGYALKYFNFAAGFSFVTAIISTSLFVALNFKGAEQMTQKKVLGTYAEDGMPSPLMKNLPPTANKANSPASSVASTTTTTVTTTTTSSTTNVPKSQK